MSIETAVNHLVYPKMENIPVSTKTFIVMTNLVLDLRKLYDNLPITEYNFIPKKRGRKKKIIDSDVNSYVPDGSIVTMKYENKFKGIDLKPKKSHKKKKSKWFRNSFTVVMILDGKPINFNIFNFSRGTSLECIFIPAMRNIDFSLGFCIDREKLAKYMTTQTEFHSLLETSFGYTGVNIKIPLSHKITDLVLKKIKYVEDDYIESTLTYGEYLMMLPEKERNKKLNKDRYNTFLVFQSGKIICSSISQEYASDAYDYFIRIIKTCKHIIEEKLDI